LKLDLAQFRELAAFSQFGSDLDKVTQNQLNRGQRLTEVLKQPQFQPLTAAQQVVIIYAGTQGLMDDLKTEAIRAFEDGLHKYMGSAQAAVLNDIMTKKALDDDLRGRLTEAIDKYKQDFLRDSPDAQVKAPEAAKVKKDEKQPAEATV
jgi:F-type H+-transporting ATPase subunit alpha